MIDATNLPAGIRSRMVNGVNGLTMHVLEAGFEDIGRPVLLLLHGFPELAYSWRKVMLPLAQAGYHVIAPDQRGYGQTTGWDADYDADLSAFRMSNVVHDAVSLTAALGFRETASVIGHDFGSTVAAFAALIRPDMFKSCVMMSAPFSGPPALPLGGASATLNISAVSGRPKFLDDLAALPRPRKHYHWYYSTREANPNMHGAPQGVHDFLRAYYHHKSADWKANKPFRLAAWRAEELAKLPTYYVMDLDKGMAETVAPEMPSPEEIAACRWLTDDELRVYSDAFARTGFQGGLNWYRARTSGANADLGLFGGLTIDVPSLFIAGASDWGVYQKPGDVETMQHEACTDMRGVHLIAGAGHWVQQEQPEETARLLLDFLRGA
ncbi:MAG: alpha/beta fold hydrolase [Variibacter sp.]